MINRETLISQIENSERIWDIVIIGGGATDLGTAVDAASRGYQTLLVEQSDFTKGTSSRSTKLVHGGVRYLAQGDIQMVVAALHDRGTSVLNYMQADNLTKDKNGEISGIFVSDRFTNK